MARTLIFLLFTAFLCSAGAQDLTLEELDSLFADCAGTPSEYAVRTAKNWFMRCAFYRLDGSALRPAVELQCRSDAEARKRIRTLSEDVRRGRNWKLPRPELAVPFIGAVRIDGIISPEEYTRSARLEGEIPINEQTVKAGGGHRWYLPGTTVSFILPRKLRIRIYSSAKSGLTRRIPWNCFCFRNRC